MSALVNKVEDDGSWITHIRVMMSEMIASRIYQLKIIERSRLISRFAHDLSAHHSSHISLLVHNIPGRSTELATSTFFTSSHRDNWTRTIVSDRACYHGAAAVAIFAA